MSILEIRNKIGIAELALKDAGPNEALNAVFDVLKAITNKLEATEKPASKELSSESPG